MKCISNSLNYWFFIKKTPGSQHQYLWSRPLGQAPGHTPIMGPPVPFPDMPTLHGVPIASSQAGYNPYTASSHGGYHPPMATSHAGYHPPMEAELVSRSKMDQLLKGQQLIIENAYLQMREQDRQRREAEFTKPLPCILNLHHSWRIPSNQQTLPLWLNCHNGSVSSLLGFCINDAEVSVDYSATILLFLVLQGTFWKT